MRLPLAGGLALALGAWAAPQHWAFQPVRRPKPPDVRQSAWVRNDIDRFVLARLEKEGIAPSPEADPLILRRRLSLDLTGLPPADNPTVEDLFRSPHYGEKWARHWLDLAQYADSDGYEKDWTRPWAWRYRQWVIDAINRNMPFDEFTIEQLAGDLLPSAGVEPRVATGFLRMTLTNREGGVDNEQFRLENVLERAATTGTVWLGLTAGCAQCHDHKYDPIPQKDFYRLAAFFDNLEEVDIDAPLPGETGAWLRTNREYRAQRQALLEEYKVPSLQAEWEKQMLHAAANPGERTDWDLAWDCLLKLTSGGDGEKIIRKKPEQRTLREADVLTDHFVRNYHFAVGGKVYRELKLPELDQKLSALRAKYPQLTQAYAVSESPDRRKSYLRIRGNYKALGPEVEPGTLSALPPLRKTGPATRLELARWLVSRENPLTSRVVVNRIWQEFFGQGLVKTSEDFGAQGERPTHPELLDWLASELMDSGWDVQHIQRLIVNSATYRQSSKARPDLAEKDPNNTLLARQARLRLPAELIRDQALAVSGLLSDRIGGPSVRPHQPAGVAELAYAGSVKWVDSTGEDRYRRGLYIHFQRTTPYPLLANFDAPRANAAACRRERTNTPLQALNLLNDPAFIEAAQALALRILSEAPAGFEPQLRRAYRLTLGRDPSRDESRRMAEYLAQQKAILDQEPGATEKLLPAPAADRLAAAAWVGAASVLLNLDEFITRE